MSDTIAQQLSAIYHELVEQRPFSEVARVPLTEAESSGRARDLLIWQCDTDVLAMPGIARRWWVKNSTGLHAGSEWPVTDALANSEGWYAEHPEIKFATDAKRVLFGMHLGTEWYVSREAALGPDGRFLVDQLVERCTHYRRLSKPRTDRSFSITEWIDSFDAALLRHLAKRQSELQSQKGLPRMLARWRLELWAWRETIRDVALKSSTSGVDSKDRPQNAP